jgi:hypothetical protein
MVEDGELVKETGFQFQKGEETYVELHVDESPVFQDECNSLPYGRHLSVRKGVGENQ